VQVHDRAHERPAVGVAVRRVRAAVHGGIHRQQMFLGQCVLPADLDGAPGARLDRGSRISRARVAGGVAPDRGAQWLAARRIDESQVLLDLLHADAIVIHAPVACGVWYRQRGERVGQGRDELWLAGRIKPAGGVLRCVRACSEQCKCEQGERRGNASVHSDLRSLQPMIETCRWPSYAASVRARTCRRMTGIPGVYRFRMQDTRRRQLRKICQIDLC